MNGLVYRSGLSTQVSMHIPRTYHQTTFSHSPEYCPTTFLTIGWAWLSLEVGYWPQNTCKVFVRMIYSNRASEHEKLDFPHTRRLADSVQLCHNLAQQNHLQGEWVYCS